MIITDKESTAIFRLQQASEMSQHLYHKPLVLTYSGGKDSDVLLHLADAAGIDYSVGHSLTTVDAPQTVQYIRKKFHELEDNGIECVIDTHKNPKATGGATTMWNLILKKMFPPNRRLRYCCVELKQTLGDGCFVALGVRRDQSRKRTSRDAFEIITRKKEDRIGITDMDNQEDREAFESCPIKGKRNVNPIIDWTDEQVYDYIESENIEMNSLYKQGFYRIGCIGCPLANKAQRLLQFERYPKYQENYIKIFSKMLQIRKANGKPCDAWSSGEQVFDKWMYN